MVVFDKEGNVVFEKLDESGMLSENTINKYDFIVHKESFNKLIDLISENYLIYGMIKELDYKVNDELEFVTFINEDEFKDEDPKIYTFERGFYDASQASCECLLYKIKLAWNNLNEVERYIIKSLFFDKQTKTDEILMDEFHVSKNKYYIQKKSGIIKMSITMGLVTNLFPIESMIENKLVWQYIIDKTSSKPIINEIKLP